MNFRKHYTLRLIWKNVYTDKEQDIRQILIIRADITNEKKTFLQRKINNPQVSKLNSNGNKF